MIPGTLMASFLNEHIGRKKALLISIITMILGATTCYVANRFASITILYVFLVKGCFKKTVSRQFSADQIR